MSGSKSSGSTDGGTASRVFGTFLQWMNDKTANVFVIATANDISQLPPEFLRKGRFDELFFVDLPSPEEREEIWRVQLRRHGRKSDGLDLSRHVQSTNQFTGAEIEACVREGLFSAFECDRDLSDADLEEAVSNTVPLSKTMANELGALRRWAEGRARLASTPLSAPVAQGRKLMTA